MKPSNKQLLETYGQNCRYSIFHPAVTVSRLFSCFMSQASDPDDPVSEEHAQEQAQGFVFEDELEQLKLELAVLEEVHAVLAREDQSRDREIQIRDREIQSKSVEDKVKDGDEQVKSVEDQLKKENGDVDATMNVEPKEFSRSSEITAINSQLIGALLSAENESIRMKNFLALATELSSKMEIDAANELEQVRNSELSDKLEKKFVYCLFGYGKIVEKDVEDKRDDRIESEHSVNVELLKTPGAHCYATFDSLAYEIEIKAMYFTGDIHYKSLKLFVNEKLSSVISKIQNIFSDTSADSKCLLYNGKLLSNNDLTVAEANILPGTALLLSLKACMFFTLFVIN